MSAKNKQFYEFAAFRLDADNSSLWLGDKPVSLPPKALELLILLVRENGNVVSREELLEKIWRDAFVEEANINYTVSLVRKTLAAHDGETRFIQTVPKRGYRFVADVCVVFPSEGITAEPKNDLSPAVAASFTAEQKNATSRRWQFLTIAIVALFFLTSFAVWKGFSDQTTLVSKRKINSIAVLPVKDLSENDANRVLAFGLTDSLISRLGSLNRFAVRPLDAVMKYERDSIGLGEKLKVDAVLEGTLQKHENRARINLRLLDARDGAQLWSASFDENEADVFKLQDALADEVAKSLLSDLTERERQIIAKRHTENAEAYRAYARGRAILDRKNPQLFEKAVDEFQKAVTLDPTFALAYAGLADTFSMADNAESGSAEFRRKAKLYAERALELESDSAEIYTALGRIKRIYDWDWQAAESYFQQAVRANPNHAGAHLYYAQMLAFLGRGDEALAVLKRASEINPISPTVAQAHFAVLESRGEIDEGLRLAEEFWRNDKENPSAKRALATFLFHKGENGRVIEIVEQFLSRDQRQKFAFLSLLATAYERTNQPEKTAETLRQLEKLAANDTKALYSLAMNYAEFDRRDEAIRALEKCFETREERMVWVKVEPRFANLKNDARFQEILLKMNLQ